MGSVRSTQPTVSSNDENNDEKNDDVLDKRYYHKRYNDERRVRGELAVVACS